MLKPARMCLIRCVVAKESREALVSELHSRGICQLIHLGDEDLSEAGLKRDSPLERAEEVASLMHRVSQLSDGLTPYRQSDSGFLEDLLGVDKTERKKVPASGPENVIAGARKFISDTESQVNDLIEESRHLKETLDRSKNRAERLGPAKDVDLPGSYFIDTPYLHSVLGTVPATADLEERLDDEFGREWAHTVHESGRDRDLVSYHAPVSRASDLDRILSAHGFRSVAADAESSLQEAYLGAVEAAGEARQRLTENGARLSELASEVLDELYVTGELLSLEYERATAPKRFGATEKVSYLMVWTPKSSCEDTREAIEDAAGGLCHLEVEEDPEDAPTLLDNPRQLRPFEMLTRMFSPPRYNQMDPTWVTAPTFVAFFGFMVADAVYGLSIALAAYLVRKKYAPYSGKVADLTYVLLWCGASTVLFGVLTGGYLGDFAAKYVAGVEPRNLPLVVIDPLYKSSSVVLLGVAVSVGLAHTVAGNVLGFADKLGQGRRSDAVKENLSWLLVIAGVGAAALGQVTAGASAFAAGFLLLLSGSGFMAVMELPTLLGRVVSYARLLALNLTTPGMGVAFNFLAALVYGIPVVGPAVAGLVFIASHVIILLMNSLGSFVHSLRLHYVEFYGTFYGGGGLEYEPFREDRKYTLRN